MTNPSIVCADEVAFARGGKLTINGDDWLDKYVAGQAAHYGLPVERFIKVMHNAAVLQERYEIEGWEERVAG